jgi:hypothetical protein
MTLTESLYLAFGESSKLIDLSGVQAYIEWECHPLQLLLSKEGRLFVSCGGYAIAQIRTVEKHTTLCFYLIIEDKSGRAWDCNRVVLESERIAGIHPQRREEWMKQWHTSRPSPQLRVVASA